MLYKGKVADEPDEWVVGTLIEEDTIYQEFEPKKGCCGVGTFNVIPETVEPIGKYWEEYFYNQGRKDLADEIIKYLERQMTISKMTGLNGEVGVLKGALNHIQELIGGNSYELQRNVK